MSAYQRAWPCAAVATELETSPVIPSDRSGVPGALGCRVGREAEAGDGDERERKQPDEEPVGKGAGDDLAARVRVAVDHLECDVDRRVPFAFRLRPLGELLRPGLYRVRAGLRRGASRGCSRDGLGGRGRGLLRMALVCGMHVPGARADPIRPASGVTTVARVPRSGFPRVLPGRTCRRRREPRRSRTTARSTARPLAVDVERATAELTYAEVVRAEHDLALGEADGGAAVAAAPRLYEHQRTVAGPEPIDRGQRRVGRPNPPGSARVHRQNSPSGFGS